VSSKREEGGYYALKGFMYQFDKTLIEVLNNPDETVSFESREDIEYEDFVLQVKHKETQEYTPSKIRKAVESLMEFFSGDDSKQLFLYCHFKDKTPQDLRLTLDELDTVISAEAKARYQEQFRKRFLARFAVRFSHDYETQFKETVTLIRSSFSLPDGDSAVLYHSIFRSKLLDRSIQPQAGRHVCFQDLRGFLQDTEVTVFQVAYSKHLGRERYAQLIKKRYFTFTAPNLENLERLFVLDCDPAVGLLELATFATRISHRFYKKGKSPAPYVIFRNLAVYRLRELKQNLFDQGVLFFDGTHFDGDRFRLDELAARPRSDHAFTLKVVSEDELINLLRKVNMKEVFQFFVDVPLEFEVYGAHRRIQVERTEYVLQMIS
jgi:hypothetical protein